VLVHICSQQWSKLITTKMKIMMMRMGMSQSTPWNWGESKLPPKDLKTMKYVTVEEEDEVMLIGGLVKKCHFFKLPLDQFWVAQFTQIALNMIPVKFDWKKWPLPNLRCCQSSHFLCPSDWTIDWSVSTRDWPCTGTSKAVDHPWLILTSILHIYKVF
jgi:hypothetical protein